MKIDEANWTPVTGLEARHLWFASGHHTVQIVVIDEAGNQAVSTVSFNTDNRALSFGGPYYGLPIVAIVLAVLVVGGVVFLRLRKRKGGPVVSSAPKEESAPRTL
jgi:hypothetical protein